MFNPAYPFTRELLESFIAKDVKHFVKSTYKRGTGEDAGQAFLISHYHEEAEAKRHFNAITKDAGREIYNIGNVQDLERLSMETLSFENKKVFSILMHPESEKRATEKFRENTKRYLFKNTNWDLKGKRISIFPKLYYQLGELYVRIAHQEDEIKMKFEELENS